MEQTIMSGIKLGSVDVGSNTRRREGEVGDKLSSGEALGLLSGHWQHRIAVGKRCREKHRPGAFGRQSSPAISSIGLEQTKLSPKLHPIRSLEPNSLESGNEKISNSRKIFTSASLCLRSRNSCERNQIHGSKDGTQ